MPKHEVSVVIKRPVEEVFAFVENPENDPIWRHSRVGSELEAEGESEDDPVDASGGEGPRGDRTRSP